MKAQDLKNSILQMAMEGKLVPQDPNDEPASVLLERIKEEKEQLIKEKKIKRNNKESIIFRKNNHFYEKIGKNKPVCIDDDIPWEIPNTWEWVKFGSVVDFSLGKTPQRKNPDYWEEGTIPWVSIADMNDGEIINLTKEKVNDYALEKSFKGNLVPKNTLLMSFKLTVGKVSILGMDAVHNEAIISIKPLIDENYVFRDYLFYILPFISQLGDTKSAIKGKTLNSKSLNNLFIPLPNLNEQKRIVKKIKELNPFIKEYGIYEEKLEILNNEFPSKIKDSILQEAIQGKLVPQDPDDEPASVLLERIREEKEQLIKEKKIKRNKNESFIFKENNHFYEKVGKKGEEVCIDDEIPFDIPYSWEWTRIKNISEFVTKGTTPKGGKSAYKKEGIKFLRVENIGKNGELLLENIKYISEDTHNNFLKRSILNENDLLISIAGALGRTAIVPKSALPLNTNQAVSLVRWYNTTLFSVQYIEKAINSPGMQKLLLNQSKITAIPNLTLEIIRECLIPIPPLNEQKRIVKKVEYLFDLLKFN